MCKYYDTLVFLLFFTSDTSLYSLQVCLNVQLVSKISNLCDPDPPTSQTDGRTDDVQSH